LPSADRISVAVRAQGHGHVAEVTVRDRITTTHHVRVSPEEREKYGADEVADLVRRSFEFLLARESNTSILRDFDLSAIEGYFPEYSTEIRRR
jgi:hypothetical protein